MAKAKLCSEKSTDVEETQGITNRDGRLKTRMDGLLGEDNGVSLCTSAQWTGSQEDKRPSESKPESATGTDTNEQRDSNPRPPA